MASSVPRLLNHEITKQWSRNPNFWSPKNLLAGDASFFPNSSLLTVKKSQTSRFFMYEEHASMKLKDEIGQTQTIQLSPSDLAAVLHGPHGTPKESNGYHYWTSPVASVAPGLLTQIKGYETLHEGTSQPLDPRGPSLWMGNSGSGTQAHYDVADNVICQLFGTKRIRCYSPKAASALHVFPDAHPRARKSQVNFDDPDHDLYPHYASLPPPDVDVELVPGSALFVPAFWFHHVENGNHCSTPQKGVMHPDSGPSVSLNMFALSKSMMIAHGIFRDASRPFQVNTSVGLDFKFAVKVLRALSWRIMKELRMEEDPTNFIQKHLLDTRYAPLRRGDIGERSVAIEAEHLSNLEEKAVSNCIARILPQFEILREEDDGDGIVSLVLCHLFELWAVELVGAASVAEVWEAVLHTDN